MPEYQINPVLKDYVEHHIFPKYQKNDGGHNLAHIKEVIRRSFELNDEFSLGLDPNLIYTIAACHDLGKFEDHFRHHLIAAKYFMSDKKMPEFFSQKELQTIKEAIEDHRSSKKDEPRSIYGKLISSADRNSTIEIVFIRSFFVGKERMPESTVKDYLNYTIERLSKKYDEKDPENMFFEDKIYQDFLQKMRNLLKNQIKFKNKYCKVNHISSRQNKLKDEPGAIEYAAGVNPALIQYINHYIFPKYKKYYSHGISHINHVLENMMMLADYYDLDKDMAYAIACYHDIGLKVDRENHEYESGKILLSDQKLNQFFTTSQVKTMQEAIEDHRGSKKDRPRSIYGECISDSDRDFDVQTLAKRQLATSLKNYPNLSTSDEHFERCHAYICKRINQNGVFNLWTNHPTLIKRRDKFQQEYLNKSHAKIIYQKEWDKMLKNGIKDKINHYYEDY